MISDFQEKLLEWYETDARREITEQFSTEGKELVKEQENLAQAHKDLEKQLTGFTKEEHKAAQSQERFLDQKLNEFEERLRHLNGPSLYYRDALVEEIERSRNLRDEVIRDLSVLADSLKK